jgi:RNA polymerase sigma-70 factor (ECF subfamily)
MGLAQLPPRCREVVTLRRIDGLSTREVAERLNIATNTVDQQMVHGMRALVEFMLGGSGKVRRTSATRNDAKGAES